MKNTTSSHRTQSFARRAISTGICIALLCGTTVGAQAQSAPPSEGTSKFGLLEVVSYAGLTLLQTFTNWASTRADRAGQAPMAGAMQQPPSPVSLASMFVNRLATDAQNVLATSAPGSQGMWVQTPQPHSANPQFQQIPFSQAPYFSPAPVVVGQPDVPLAMQQAAFDPNKPWDNKANYQSIAVSAQMLDDKNRVIDTRSLAAAFRTGERFKLRLISTFDAIVSIDSLRAVPGTVNANGVFTAPPTWAGQLYPAKADQVVQIKAGEVVLLPLGSNEYFTFDGKTGLELLSLNVRHPQASSNQVNRQPVYRQDGQGMTAYSQLVQNGTYTALTQILALQHGN